MTVPAGGSFQQYSSYLGRPFWVNLTVSWQHFKQYVVLRPPLCPIEQTMNRKQKHPFDVRSANNRLGTKCLRKFVRDKAIKIRLTPVPICILSDQTADHQQVTDYTFACTFFRIFGWSRDVLKNPTKEIFSLDQLTRHNHLAGLRSTEHDKPLLDTSCWLSSSGNNRQYYTPMEPFSVTGRGHNYWISLAPLLVERNYKFDWLCSMDKILVLPLWRRSLLGSMF